MIGSTADDGRKQATAAPRAAGVTRPFRWTVADPAAEDSVRALAAELLLPDELCRLLLVRGYHTPDSARNFLRPKLEELHDPRLMLGMDAAVERIRGAISRGERILVHGDYDVDGICSTTVLVRVLRSLGATVQAFIPRRLEDGYDLGAAGVNAASACGAALVITCDCGTSASSFVRELCSAGIDVIITDHHLPPAGDVPDCTAVLNPRQRGCPYPDKDLAGVGVAFKLMQALVRAMGADDGRVLALLDLVALATVADVAPLRGENRILVRSGLRLMRETRNAGLRALIRSSGLSEKPVNAGRVGFILAPRLNAVGRLGKAIRGVELLLSESEHDANSIARELEELNYRRQEIDRATLSEAREMFSRLPADDTFGVVLASENWHAGVIGIVASRMVEETGRPTVLIAVSDGTGKGSGRSIPAFDLHAGLTACSSHLRRYGGHRTAAGVTVDAADIPAFAAAFNDVVRKAVAPEDFLPELRVDLEISVSDCDLDSVEKYLRHFEPFGPSNPGPVFLARGMQVTRSPRKVGENGLRFIARDGDTSLEMLGWNLYPRRGELTAGAPVDIVFRIERDEWNGANRIQGRVLDFRTG